MKPQPREWCAGTAEPPADVTVLFDTGETNCDVYWLVRADRGGWEWTSDLSRSRDFEGDDWDTAVADAHGPLSELLANPEEVSR